MEQLNTELVTRSLNFHGQQLQKIWEAERGDTDLTKHGIKDLDFMQYAQRQKHLSFQDRGKRLKLHQFIVKKANMLFNSNALDNILKSEPEATEDVCAVMCPFETFLSVDKQARLRYFFEHVKIGDLILGTIVSKTTAGMLFKVLCTAGSTVRYVADINVKAFCPVANIIPAVDRKGVSRNYMMNDSVCCEVLEVIPDTDKMVCGMKGTTRQPGDPDPKPALGLISAEDFPLEYKKALDNKGESYDAVLEKSVGFNNPNNIAHLSKQMEISSDDITLMVGLRGRFPEQEYANELRQVQASKWAFRSVADGIDHFKAGRHTEAFQCLNKALTIDPKNVEGLVARGALYANSGNFQKAIEDFETALKLNPSHANARKYMGETLVALGRSYEDENKFEEAKKAYQSCLTIIPFHEEAQNSLDFLKNKQNAPKNLIETGDLLLPNLGTNKPFESKEILLKQMNKAEDGEKKDKKKKKKSKKRKNRHHSSSSSSSSSSGSTHSSSSSSSSSSDSSTGSSDSEFKKRKKRRHKKEKQRSLSPLSKRMAMMEPGHETSTNYQFNKPNSSFQFGFENQPDQPVPKPEDTEYELKVRSFLEQTKDGSDYEDKVRKFLEETARWKKDKKNYDKKKKKKRDKKAKKESKRKRKDKKIRHKDFDIAEFEEQIENKKLKDILKKELGVKEKHTSRKSKINDVADYILEKAGLLGGDTDFDALENKLRQYYAESKRSDRSESEEPKHVIMDSPSPTREQKARQTVAEASSASGVSTGKWKMQIGSVQGASRFKKRTEKDEWMEHEERERPSRNERSDRDRDHERDRDRDRDSNKPKSGALPLPEEKGISVRKAMALKEPPPKKELPLPDPPKPKPKPIIKQPIIQPGQVVLDKFGSFRLLSPSAKKMPDDDDMPPLPPGEPKYRGKPPEPPGRPRSGSRSPKRKSRSRSRGKYSRGSSRSSSASRSRGRSRSRSYRSRSRSYYSRSRSRSGSRSYYSRSRSRSRSYSGDRRRMDRRGGFRGRYGDRGTYYKPRFQPYKGYSRGGRGGYRDNRDYRDYRDFRGRGRRGFSYQNRRPRGGRFRGGGYRDFRDRRYDRSHSRDISRSRSREHDNDAMKKVNEEKEKINKYIDNGDEPVRHEGPLSEGEDRDDYSSDKFVDRQSYEGKWAEKEGEPEEGKAAAN